MSVKDSVRVDTACPIEKREVTGLSRVGISSLGKRIQKSCLTAQDLASDPLDLPRIKAVNVAAAYFPRGDDSSPCIAQREWVAGAVVVREGARLAHLTDYPLHCLA